MKAVNVDDVLRILHKYGKYIFVTDEKRYSSMIDEIANLKALETESCEDAISRRELLKAIDTYDKFGYWGPGLIPLVSEDRVKLVPYIHYDDVIKCIKLIPSVQTEQKTGHWKDFAVWVAKEIFDDAWEYNKDTFAEIACRKLNKLGIVKAKGDEWELIEPQESV